MNPDLSVPETALPLSDQECHEGNKTLLLEALKRAGAIQATVNYHGGGDEGLCNDAEARTPEGKVVDLSETTVVFRKQHHLNDGQWTTTMVKHEQPLGCALSDYAMEAVDRYHGGWENGEGGCGEVFFDCEHNTINIKHNNYVIETAYTETRL